MTDEHDNKPADEPAAREDGNIPRAMGRHSLILTAFAVLVALSVGLVNESTEERIAYQRQSAERNALAEVLPATQHDNDLLSAPLLIEPDAAAFEEIELLGLREPRPAYLGRRDDRISGVILPVTVRDGYSGDILLLVGVLPDGSVSGVRVLSHRETPGLGDKIERRISDWILSFNGRSLGNPPTKDWRVEKDGGEFDQFVGATVTPRAVVGGVRKALRFFELNADQLLNRDPT